MTLRSSGIGWAASMTSIRERLRRGAAVPDHDRAAMQPLAEDPLEGERDLQARLAGAEDDHLPVRVEPVAAPVDDQLVSLDRDHTLDREAGIAGGEACLGDPDGELSRTGETLPEQG